MWHGYGMDRVLKANREASEMKELITYIAKALVDNPDEVEVTEIEGEHSSVIELKVAKGDLGKVIGKQGRTAQRPGTHRVIDREPAERVFSEG
jgi:predicted RNA-binding protein YlqC (UPF0109 family)